MNAADAEALVARIRDMPTTSEVRALVTDYVFGLMAPKK
jgi:hypothetical protein